jgi:hypothetical protein
MISVHESACGKFDNETLDLTLSEDNLGDHRIQVSDLPGHDNEHKRNKIQIWSNTLDTLCPIEPAENTLIWIDTQGYEGYVLAGARRWLDAGTPVVLEFQPYLMKRANSFGLMKGALANYAGFYDLWQKPYRFRPISDLDDLYAELGKAGDFAEIGAGKRRRPGHVSGRFTNILAIGKTGVKGDREAPLARTRPGRGHNHEPVNSGTGADLNCCSRPSRISILRTRLRKSLWLTAQHHQHDQLLRIRQPLF